VAVCHALTDATAARPSVTSIWLRSWPALGLLAAERQSVSAPTALQAAAYPTPQAISRQWRSLFGAAAVRRVRLVGKVEAEGFVLAKHFDASSLGV